MPCFSPLHAWQMEGGEIVFSPRAGVKRELDLRCGQCVGCRLEKSRQWAVRCLHEAQMHEYSSFVTLTYDDEHLPGDCSLRYSDFQKFMKRLRRLYSERQRIRFYMCGEYGETYGRPHYHACLFGVHFFDRYDWRVSGSGFRLYRSPILEKLWSDRDGKPIGTAEIGDVTFESAAYVARYIMKKVTGDAADEYYKVVDSDTGEIFWRVPEFTHMSLKPGIGATWFEKYKREVYPLDRVVVRGVEQKPPKFYDKLLEREAGTMIDDIEYSRYLNALKFAEDSTPSRLLVREKVLKRRLSDIKRGDL